MSLDVARIAQIEAWLERFRSDGQRFDFVQGFATALVCALPLLGEIDDELALLSFVDDPRNFEPPAGFDRRELAEAIRELCDSLEDDLVTGDFRPYMGGKYVNRIKPDTPCADWCRGFTIGGIFFSEESRNDEDLKTMLVPAILLGSPSAIDELLPEAPPQEKAETEAFARQDLIPSVDRIFHRLRSPDEDE